MEHELVTTACPRLRENDSSLTMLWCVRVTPSLMQGSMGRPLTKPKHEPLPPACATTPICGDSCLFFFSHFKSFEMILCFSVPNMSCSHVQDVHVHNHGCGLARGVGRAAREASPPSCVSRVWMPSCFGCVVADRACAIHVDVCSCPRFWGTNIGDSAGAVGDAAAAMPDLESLVCVSRMIFLCKHQMFSLILLKMHKIHKTALRRHSRHVSWMSICHLCAC